ncbi:MAG: BlaI/MecI/CopY family transcriptional regulator [Candidatus Korobacteraceae bacterium]|jgi:predicted transcriptional regulator
MDSVVKLESGADLASFQRVHLGPLELVVMEAMWSFGPSFVRDVVGRLDRKLAYTTVMTTLDRLFKKGMLAREMTDRAFMYSPKVSREDWDRQRAGEMMAGFLTGPNESREMLLSCLVDAVGTHDAMLLDELEKKIQRKREELAGK